MPSSGGSHSSPVVSDVSEAPRRREGRRHIVVHALARLRVTLGFVFGAIVLALAHPTPRSLGIGLGLAAVVWRNLRVSFDIDRDRAVRGVVRAGRA